MKRGLNMIKSKIWLIILIFIPTTGFGQTRLATSSLMVKTQMQNGYSINPIQDGEMRFSGDYLMYNGVYNIKSTSDWNVGDSKYTGNSLVIGFDRKTDFGHYSFGYGTEDIKREWVTKVTFSDGCTADYSYSYTYKNTETFLGISTNLGKTTLLAAIDMVSKKTDIARGDTLTRGCTWTSTGTANRSSNGTGSGDYNVFVIVGKTELTEKLLLGFTGVLEATDKSKYTDDWSTSDNRMGNGMRMGVSVGSETSMRAFEGGIIIENESKDSGDGNSMYIFGLYEGRFGGGGYLIGYSNGSEEKVVDGTEYISRPNSFSTIDLQVQYELDEGMYFSGDLKKIDVKYGDYGIATKDEVKTNTLAENDIKLGINVVF